ncbi:amino acid ABC transporter permease [Streptomyces sp. NPDC002643]
MTFLHDWAGFLPALLDGLWISLQLTVFSLVMGLPLGLGLAIANGSGGPLIRRVAVAVVEIGRGMPALVMLQIVYFGLPEAGLTLTAFLSAGIGLGLTTAAYTSEIIRGGLQAVPQGEVEAAQALNMSRTDTLRYIIVPQGLRVAIPALMGFAVLIFQSTALAYTIALPELLGAAYSIGSSTFQYLSVLTLAGLLYAAVTIPASLLTEQAERRLSRHL